MSYEDKILDKFADMIMPPGTIIAYQGIEAPEGFIVYDHVKIYEDEFPRLYPVLAANPNFNKGADSDGRKWVELPEIEDLCIQMTTDTSQVGKTLEAQLPNIRGWIGDIPMGANSATSCYGALSQGEKWTSADIMSGDYAGYWTLDFNAANSSVAYKAEATTVQPPALQLLPCIRF